MAEWYDGIIDAAEEFGKSAVSAASSMDWESIAKDALAGAVIAEISGGDVWKAAAYSGFGSIVGSSDFGKELFGDFSTEFGGAISGYGIADATGESGLLGGLAGAGYKYLNKDLKTGGGGILNTTGENGETDSDVAGRFSNQPSESELAGEFSSRLTDVDLDEMAEGTIGGESLNWLKENGLVKEDGTPTLLGEAGVKSIAGLYAAQQQKEQLKELYKIQEFKREQTDKSNATKDELEFKAKQRQTAGFARYGRK
tara:strand:+ start:151 stop:915 length:765 start_codon:yes stop_codon:yes gene_type:complete